TVALDASASSDSDGTIISYTWSSAPDGQTAAGTTASLTFNGPGTYTVTLDVTDNGGKTAQAQKTVTVTAAVTPNASPTAAFSVSPESGEAPLTVALDASASSDSDGTIVSYTWSSAPDGQTAAGTTASLTFNGPGTYTVTLEVTDNGGKTAQAQKTVTVTQNAPPTAAFSVSPESGEAPLTVSLDGSASVDPDGSIVSYTWSSAPDGQTAAGETASLTFNEPGAYTVTLEVTDNGGKTVQTQEAITVTEEQQPPVAIFTATLGATPLTVELDASASYDPDGDVVDYQWNGSDGQTASGRQVTMSFSTEGTYDIDLAVKDNDGLFSTESAQQTVVVDNSSSVKPVEISFLNALDFYHVNDTVNIRIGETQTGESRSESVDLWVVVRTPGGEFLFKSPASAFSPEPQAFKTGIAPSETEHPALESMFTEKGEYTLYALYVREGANPVTGDFLEMLRSNLASFTFNLLGLAEINFDGMQDFYEAGETVSITVTETEVTRSERVDLWVVVMQMPPRILWFRTSSPFIPFSPEPQVFKAGIEPSNTVHPVFEFEVPPGMEGEYIFFALYVREGANPLAEDISIIQRSNIAVFQLQFE
ncbi:MAG: PKD domain-containing protein, partial [Gammaproteobacteria bacterium]|nr:PKD domain-containing protein [Gammaproteobacteria bacterium]